MLRINAAARILNLMDLCIAKLECAEYISARSAQLAMYRQLLAHLVEHEQPNSIKQTLWNWHSFQDISCEENLPCGTVRFYNRSLDIVMEIENLAIPYAYHEPGVAV